MCSGSEDGSIRVWRLDTLAEERVLNEGGEDEVSDGVYSAIRSFVPPGLHVIGPRRRPSRERRRRQGSKGGALAAAADAKAWKRCRA